MLIATVLFPTPPLAEKTTTNFPGADRVAVGAGVRAPASRSPTRTTDWASAPGSVTATVSRSPARSAAWSSGVETSSTATMAANAG